MGNNSSESLVNSPEEARLLKPLIDEMRTILSREDFDRANKLTAFLLSYNRARNGMTVSPEEQREINNMVGGGPLWYSELSKEEQDKAGAAHTVMLYETAFKQFG